MNDIENIVISSILLVLRPFKIKPAKQIDSSLNSIVFYRHKELLIGTYIKL